MVQILVHVRPADRWNRKRFELLECAPDTLVSEVKRQVQQRGAQDGSYDLPPDQQELVFMGERCRDDKALRDYGISEDFIKQVTGFVINPQTPGKEFHQGVLQAVAT